ncbi:30S ribosomal protein [Vigna angularis]|uniref:30S ribosomal protein n=1 Tax=Phaseolus angularis TaxID=3914 RepID=A0A8T0K4L6_PHAAN|nr:30S ribosomal protein [Vigna angularis]
MDSGGGEQRWWRAAAVESTPTETAAFGVPGDPAEQSGSATQIEAERENPVLVETDAVRQENGPRHAPRGSIQVREVSSSAVSRATVDALPFIFFLAFLPPKINSIRGSGETESLPASTGPGRIRDDVESKAKDAVVEFSDQYSKEGGECVILHGNDYKEKVRDGFEDRVVQVRRVMKVVKGGKQLPPSPPFKSPPPMPGGTS